VEIPCRRRWQCERGNVNDPVGVSRTRSGIDENEEG
jgi:hypothetical protein